MRGKIEPETVAIGTLPLYHIFGINSVLNASVYLGLTIELFDHFDPETVIGVIEKEKRTLLFAVPAMYNRLVAVAEQRPPRKKSLKFCVSGEASLSVEFLQRFEALFGARIYEGYGLTEVPACVENPYAKEIRPGSIGLPIPEFSVRVVDEDDDDVPRGETGELIVRGPGVMKGYLNHPGDTAITLRGGWLHTGDIARMDQDGYLYIVGRTKDLIT